jgi:hypothetical protein
MTVTEHSNGLWKIIITAALMIGLLGLLMVMSAEAETGRLDRKIKVMERVLDEILVQSEHIVVGHGNTARGLLLDEFGALFVIEGSLGANEFIIGSGATVWTIGEDRLLRSMAEPAPPKGGHDEVDWEKMKEEAEKKKAENFKALKRELSEALVDYGATLTELADDQWVAIALFLGERAFLGAEDGERVVLKIKMSDLRRHASGSLSTDAAVNKVVIDAS